MTATELIALLRTYPVDSSVSGDLWVGEVQVALEGELDEIEPKGRGLPPILEMAVLQKEIENSAKARGVNADRNRKALRHLFDVVHGGKKSEE